MEFTFVPPFESKIIVRWSGTVTVQVAVLLPSVVVTVIVAVPAETAVTVPFDTIATELFEDVQDIALFVALLGATVAVKVKSPPVVNVLFVSFNVTPVTETVIGAGAFTVTVQVAVLLPSVVVTVIVAVPAETAVTVPFDTVAIELLEDVQDIALFVALLGATVAVKVKSLPVVNVLFVSFNVTPVTETVIGVGAFTVTVQVAVLLPSVVVTVIVAVPAETAVTVPFDTVAIELLEDVQISLCL
ncbi:hypothetical protein FACS1894211_02030 [Clostridia bacterium]|nr:hypothetical protein FACS1894211_02030 [Clostridia bacterium]